MNYADQIDLLIRHIKQLKYMMDAQTECMSEILTAAKVAIDGLTLREGRIAITGVGKNASLAMKASETFASLGIPSLYLNTGHLSHGDFGFIGSGDLIFHLSRSGTTAEMLHASRHIAQIFPAVHQVLLCCQEIGTFDLSKSHSQFDSIFYTGIVEEIDKNNLAPTTSTTLLLILLDLIGTNLSDYFGFRRSDFLKYHPGGALGMMLSDEGNP